MGFLPENYRTMVAGALSGTVSAFVFFPFDTLKIRMQVQHVDGTGHGFIHCIRSTLRNEGFFALYKGVTYPISCTAVVKGINLSVVAYSRAYFQARSSNGEMSLLQSGFCGSLSALAVSPLISPMETVKIHRQTHYSKVEKGPIAAVRDFIRAKGVRALFRGYHTTLLRDVWGTFFYIGMFEQSKIAMVRLFHDEGTHTKELPFLETAICGSIAGMSGWTSCYPLDYIKTLQQAETRGPGQQRTPFFTLMAQVVKQKGVRSLYHGLGPCLARAAPLHAMTLGVFEWLLKQPWF